MIADIKVRERGYGLGSLLVQCAIAEAKRSGGKRLSGFVIWSDFEKSPFLLQWYDKLGFTVLWRNAQLTGDAMKDSHVLVANFTMRLRE